MELIIRHQFRDLGKYYVTTFFNKLYDKLCIDYPQYSFTIKNEPQFENNGYGSIYSCMSLSIINPESKKYILISFFDNWKYHFYLSLGWDPNKMIQFFYPAGFNYIDYFNFKYETQNNSDIQCPNSIKNIYKPIYYNTYEDNEIELINNLYQNNHIEYNINQLYFCGTINNENYNNIRYQVYRYLKNNSSILFDDKKFNYKDYLIRMSKYKCALSLPGGTEICNRDIEAFAIGVPVIRPYLNIQYEDPLIPNYHYISCYTDCKYWDGLPKYSNIKELANNIEYYWNLIKDNTEYLNFIQKNARDWYIKNCKLQNNINYVLSKLDLGGLND